MTWENARLHGGHSPEATLGFIVIEGRQVEPAGPLGYGERVEGKPQRLLALPSKGARGNPSAAEALLNSEGPKGTEVCV